VYRRRAEEVVCLRCWGDVFPLGNYYRNLLIFLVVVLGRCMSSVVVFILCSPRNYLSSFLYVHQNRERRRGELPTSVLIGNLSYYRAPHDSYLFHRSERLSWVISPSHQRTGLITVIAIYFPSWRSSPRFASLIQDSTTAAIRKLFFSRNEK